MYGLAGVIYGRFGTDSMPRTTMSICSVGELWMLVRFATSIIVGDKICTIPTGVWARYFNDGVTVVELPNRASCSLVGSGISRHASSCNIEDEVMTNAEWPVDKLVKPARIFLRNYYSVISTQNSGCVRARHPFESVFARGFRKRIQNSWCYLLSTRGSKVLMYRDPCALRSKNTTMPIWEVKNDKQSAGRIKHENEKGFLSLLPD